MTATGKAHFFYYLTLTDPANIVKLVSEHEVAAQQSPSLDCQAEGNPQPTYSWKPCDSKQSVCHESVLNIQVSNESVYTFTCKVENYLGSDTRNTTLCKLARAKLCVMIIHFQNDFATSGSCNLSIYNSCAVITVTSL